MVFDLIFILILCFAIFRGWKKGFFRSVSQLLSLIISGICTSMYSDAVTEWVSTMPLYQAQCEKLTVAIHNASGPKDTFLMTSLAEGAGRMAETMAQNCLSTLISGLCFVAFCIIFNILFRFLNKVLLHIPIAGSINRFLGMVFSFVVTFVMAYIIIGALGGVATYSSSVFMRDQMENSNIVSWIYENNQIQEIF